MYLRSEGFDTYGGDVANMLVSQWSACDGILTTTNPRTGTYCLRFTQNDFARIAYGSAKTTVISCFAYRTDNVPVGDMLQFWRFKDAANSPQVTIGTTSTGAIRAMRGDWNGTLLGTSADLVIGAGAYYFIESKVTINGSTGSVEVRVNGVTVLNLSGINTQATGLASTSQFDVGHRSAGSSQFYNIDDFFLLDDTGTYLNDFIGDHAVVEDVVDADGAFADWTSNISGDLYEAVDDIPQDGDTTYVEGADVYDRVSFGFPTLPPEYTGVACVELFYIGRKTAAGDGSITVLAESNGVEEEGDTDALTETYNGYGSPFETDPDTGLPWSTGRAGAVEMILERTA